VNIIVQRILGIVVLLATMSAITLACEDSETGDPASEIETETGSETGTETDTDNRASDDEVYDIAFQSCNVFPPKKIARDLGISSTNPVDLADAFADGYQDWARQSAFEGCLAGIEAQD
jgi:hypothetical protein